jgi:uncharacterized protein YdeI (BOF family)
MKKFALTFLAFASLLGASTTVLSAGPNPPNQLTTVSWVVAMRNHPSADGRYVILIGHVTQNMGGNTYMFTDGTGSIQLDGGKYVLPVNQPLVIRGRINQPFLFFGSLEVDLTNWQQQAAQ